MKPHKKGTYFIISVILYILSIAITVALLLTEPGWFDVKAAFIPLVIVLLLASMGIAYKVAYTAHRPWITTLGTVALTVLCTFIGFFIAVGIGWIYVLSKAAS